MSNNASIMTAAPNIERLDFQTPRRPDVSSTRILRRWLNATSSLIEEQWRQVLAKPVSLQGISIEPAMDASAFREVPGDSIGAELAIGEGTVPSLIVMSHRLAQGLIADILALETNTWPNPMPPSPAEQSMLELLFENTATALGESWPGQKALRCDLVRLHGKPLRARAFLPGTALLLGKFQIKTRFGDDLLYWLTPKESIESLIAAETELVITEEHHSQQALTRLVEQLPVAITVELGRSELSMSEIANLAVGDVLVLDQSVYRPLLSRVGKEIKWKGHPVALGTRLGLEITNVLTDDTPDQSQRTTAAPRNSRTGAT